MSKIDVRYHQLLQFIVDTGYKYPDPNRKGVERLEIPSYTFRHEFKDGFPAISTKKLHYKNVVTELLWFLKGDTNIKYLIDNGCNIWNKDAYKHALKFHNPGGYLTEACKVKSLNDYVELCKQGTFTIGGLGPVYGKQWRNFDGVDQISNLIQGLKDKPLGTEHIVTTWNPGEKSKMALPACHYGFQIVVRPLNQLELIKYNIGKSSTQPCKYGFELHWNQRSVDTFLGLPYNIASYATLALIIEKLTGYKVLAIQGDLKKVHLYDNSIDAVKEQLSRDINKYDQCKLDIEDRPEYYRIKTYGLETCSLDNLLSNIEINDFKLENYESYPAINVEMLERN